MVERIQQLAKAKGIKQVYLEEQIGGYRGKISDWKMGKSSPNGHDIERLAELLGTTEAYLRGETIDPRPGRQETAAPNGKRPGKSAVDLLMRMVNVLDDEEFTVLEAYVERLKRQRM